MGFSWSVGKWMKISKICLSHRSFCSCIAYATVYSTFLHIEPSKLLKQLAFDFISPHSHIQLLNVWKAGWFCWNLMKAALICSLWLYKYHGVRLTLKVQVNIVTTPWFIWEKRFLHWKKLQRRSHILAHELRYFIFLSLRWGNVGRKSKKAQTVMCIRNLLFFLKISNSSVKKKLCSMTVRKCLQHESYDLTFQNSRQSDIKIKSLIEPWASASQQLKDKAAVCSCSRRFPSILVWTKKLF